jgi:hypothetical protein
MYQWRIRAKNSSSETQFATRTITIDSTMNLSGQILQLSLPADNSFINTFTKTFSWQTLPNTQYYIFQVLQNGSLVETNTLTTTSASYSFLSEGTYQWRVFAQNSTSNSSYLTRTVTVDTTKPIIPSLLFPLSDTISTEPIQLGWNESEIDLTFRLQISTDSTFNSVTKDTTTAETTYNLYNTVIGQYYYWRVKAIDKATNQSSFSIRSRVKKN